MFLKWTDEHHDLLNQLFKKGSAAWIAREINKLTGSTFTRNAVIGKCHKLGLGNLSPEERVAKKANRQARKKRESKRGVRQPASFTVIDSFAENVRPDHLGISFSDLQPQHCRFPKGDGLDATYCGQQVKEGQSYCPACYRICYTRPLSPQERQQRAA